MLLMKRVQHCKETIVVAQDFVEQLFQGTVDKAGKPYIEHCKFVSKLAEDSAAILGMSEDDQLIVSIAGMCHDVLEDTDTTYEQLIDLIGPSTAKIVKLCTHDKDVSYDDYLKQVCTDRLAMVVKYADATHNSMITRFPEDQRTVRRAMLCKRYRDRAEMLWTKLTKGE